MKWEDFIDNVDRTLEIQGLQRTDIECPECGHFLYKRTDIVLSSYPPKYKYECPECGWVGCA